MRLNRFVSNTLHELCTAAASLAVLQLSVGPAPGCDRGTRSRGRLWLRAAGRLLR
jgi:hypothetical protein